MSRKKQVNQKITARYCRISLEDGGDNESMSIGNQKIMLRDFAKKMECSSMSIMWMTVIQAATSTALLFSA